MKCECEHGASMEFVEGEWWRWQRFERDSEGECSC